MRIFDGNKNKVLNKIEISLTIAEALDFNHRIDDLANNPHYLDDVIFEAANGEDNGFSITNSAIFIIIYTDKNVESFSERSKRIVKEDI